MALDSLARFRKQPAETATLRDDPEGYKPWDGKDRIDSGV